MSMKSSHLGHHCLVSYEMDTTKERWYVEEWYDIVDCEFKQKLVYNMQTNTQGLTRILKAAEQMNICPEEAVRARLRYLRDDPEATTFSTEVDSLLKWLRGDRNSGSSVSEDMKEYAHTLDVRVLLDYLNIPYKASGLMSCPFHNDRNDSASVAKGVLYCFAGCKPTNSSKDCYDAVAIYRELTNVGYYDAVKEVCGL